MSRSDRGIKNSSNFLLAFTTAGTGSVASKAAFEVTKEALLDITTDKLVGFLIKAGIEATADTIDENTVFTVKQATLKDYVDVVLTNKVEKLLMVEIGGLFSEPHEYKDITFVSIPGGTFQMGDVENYGQFSTEKPVHTVTVSSFEMSIFEITQGQYQSLMAMNPSQG